MHMVSSTVASLYGVCLKRVDDLLNRTLPAAGTSGSTKQVGEVTEKNSTYDRLRWSKYSPNDLHNQNISINRQNHCSSSLIMPYRTHSSRRGTRDKLVSTQDHDSLGFLPVCMKSSWGWSLSPAYPFLTVKHLQYALMRVTLSLHKNNVCSKSKWCCNRIKTPHKNIMPEFRMLASKSMQGGALFESFLLSPFLFWKNIQITNISKKVQNVVSNIFEINLKIN